MEVNYNKLNTIQNLESIEKKNKMNFIMNKNANILSTQILKNSNTNTIEAFESFDKDKNGQISKNELIETLNAEKCQEKEIEKFIKAVDKDGNGKISKEEFMALMKED